MPHIHSKSSRAAIAVMVLALAAVALAACGGSSTSSTPSTSSSTVANASATTSTPSTPSTTSTSSTTPPAGGPAGTPPANGPARFSGRFTALRECLKKNGVTLPERKPGQGAGTGGFFGGPGGTPKLPSGMSRSQYEAIFKKCSGGIGFNPGRFPRAANRFNSPAVKEALAKFAACMRENGVNVPEPNTSGNGPIFNDKGLDTSSPQFKAAEAKCRSAIAGAFRARDGAAGAPPANG